jgi:alpha-ribazole phosphatase
MDFGAWEGCTYEQLKDNPAYRSWIDDPAAGTPPGGESWAAFTARLEQFLCGLILEAEAELELTGYSQVPHASPGEPERAAASTTASPGESLRLRVLIVTHGGVIRQLIARNQETALFHSTAAPQPGTVTAVKMRWHPRR